MAGIGCGLPSVTAQPWTDIRWRVGFKTCFDNLIVQQDFSLRTFRVRLEEEDPRSFGFDLFRKYGACALRLKLSERAVLEPIIVVVHVVAPGFPCGRILRQAAYVPNVRTTSTGGDRGLVRVTYIQHPMRRLASAESHFARMETCRAAVFSLDPSGVPVVEALKLLSLTLVLLTRLGSAATWAMFLSPNAVAWIVVPGYLNPPTLHVAKDPSLRLRAMPYRWRADVGDDLSQACHQCVGVQLGCVSTVFHFPRNFGAANVTLSPGSTGNGGHHLALLNFDVSSPVLHLAVDDFDLGWAVALQLLGQRLEVQDREVLIHGLSAPVWTEALSDELKGYIWPKAGPRTDVEAGEHCAALGVLEAHQREG